MVLILIVIIYISYWISIILSNALIIIYVDVLITIIDDFSLILIIKFELIRVVYFSIIFVVSRSKKLINIKLLLIDLILSKYELKIIWMIFNWLNE